MTPQQATETALLASIVDQVNVGIVVLDRDHRIVRWNDFMATHSGLPAESVLDRNLFEVFPDLPRRWLEVKLRSVMHLRTRAFTSWEQRPYLFPFRHNRSATEDLDWMRQDCTLMPIEDGAGDVSHVCITVQDVTDVSLYRARLQATLEHIEAISVRDGLTGVYNRRHLEVLATQEIGRAERHGGPLSVVLFDLDHFKAINDGFGHRAGDDVLCEVSRRVETALRVNDHLGRYGGEEFVLILPDTSLDGAGQVAERVRRSVHDTPVETDAGSLEVSVTLGVAEWQLQEPVDALLDRADRCLYRGKKAGRNRVSLANET